MKAVSIFLSLSFLCVISQAQSLRSEQNASSEPPRFVVVGDSLSAGVENFSLLDTQQPNGYASVIARQAGWPLTLPLVPFPGAPNVLQVVSLGPPISIEPASGELPIPPRDNPTEPVTNIAVPGLTVSSALTLRPSLTRDDSGAGMGDDCSRISEFVRRASPHGGGTGHFTSAGYLN